MKVPPIEKTISYAIFKLNQTAEMQNYWFMDISTGLAQKYLDTLQYGQETTFTRIDELRDLNSKNIDISIGDYAKKKTMYLQYVMQNNIVHQITNFENYLYNVFYRALMIKPEYISRITTSKKDQKNIEQAIALTHVRTMVEAENPKEAFAQYMAAYYLRNKTTEEMINRAAKIVNSGVENQLKPQIETLKKYVMLRNSIIHNNRLVNSELNKTWDDKFRGVDRFIILDKADINDLNYKLFEIVESIDKQFCSLVGKRDIEEIVKELYTENGFEDIQDHNRFLSRYLNSTIKKEFYDRVIRNHKIRPSADRMAIQLLKLSQTI